MFLEKFAQRFEVAPSRIGLPKGQGRIMVWQAVRDCGMDRDAMDNECVFMSKEKKYFSLLASCAGHLNSCTHLPGRIRARRVRLPQLRSSVMTEPTNEGRDTERSAPPTLGVLLLHLSDIAGNVFACRRILNCKTVRLAFHAGLVN